MVEPTLTGYRDLTMVAHGSSAFVYRAVQERLDREVAVKVLLVDDEMTTQSAVQKELDTTVSVSNHPHIVSIIDTGTTAEGQPYIVMEYCEGGSYTQILKKNGPLPVSDVVEVGIKIGQALHAAHSANIIHRDVKPQNILRAQYGPALADFGIARAAADLASTGTLDKLTPLHASPEAIRRESQTAASDLFSLASTMWHLLAGHAPFANPEGGTDPDTHRRRLEHEPPPPLPRQDVPEWLENQLRKGLSKDPADRHESTLAFAEALQQQVYGSTSAGFVRSPSSRMTWEDLADEATVFRPTDGPPRDPNAPMDPFGQHTSSGQAGMPPAAFDSALGPSHHDLKQMLSGGPAAPPQPGQQAPGAPHPVYPASGVPFSGIPASPAPTGTGGYDTPISASPASAAPVSMAPPPTPWNASAQGGPQQVSSAPVSSPMVAPPVIERKKASKAADGAGSLRPYIIMGSVVTVVLAAVMLGWLWIISPSGGNEDEPPQAVIDGDLVPTDLQIADLGDRITLSWEDPVGEGTSSFVVMYIRDVPDATYETLTTTENGATTTTINALSDTENYCFQVGFLVSSEELNFSEEVCTEREPQ
ncbi:serine/threonine-protein kinase [Natronoglycomyces albus]|uniref:non-specific serine/threonine protein kinase n=1 Tax=Natronoglycomyces albus TaxID=2811108 RepID=A0A895XUQ2_9ACTN|nr:serine/threonine-protein kinase [Natronoglycomyces albus]QSB06256.1 protein kinase [Natronoglycomyces albus]